MKNSAKKILTVVLAIAIFLIPRYALPQTQSNAFPQRDLHLRSLDESVVLKLTKTTS